MPLPVCRVCLSSNIMTADSMPYIQLQDIYEKLTATQLRCEEDLPETLCFYCYCRLHQCCKLTTTALHSDKMLRKVLDCNTKNGLRFILSLPKSRHLTKTTLKSFSFNGESNEVTFEYPRQMMMKQKDLPKPIIGSLTRSVNITTLPVTEQSVCTKSLNKIPVIIIKKNGLIAKQPSLQNLLTGKPGLVITKQKKPVITTKTEIEEHEAQINETENKAGELYFNTQDMTIEKQALGSGIINITKIHETYLKQVNQSSPSNVEAFDDSSQSSEFSEHTEFSTVCETSLKHPELSTVSNPDKKDVEKKLPLFYYCNICKKLFKTYEYLSEHQKTNHTTKKKAKELGKTLEDLSEHQKTDNKTKNELPTQNLKQVNQTYPSNLEAFDDTSQSSDLSEHTELRTVSETSLKHPELSTVSETSLKHPKLSTVSETSLKNPELSTVSDPDKKDVEKKPPVLYYCKICKKRFKTYKYLSEHQKANHITKKEKKEQVKTLEDLSEHHKTENKTKNKEPTQNLKQVHQTCPSNLEAFDDSSKSSDLSEYTELSTVSETSLNHPELSTVPETSLKHPELSRVSETSLEHPELRTVSDRDKKEVEKKPPVFYYCKICKKQFKTYEYLSEHQKTNHTTKKKAKELVKTLEDLSEHQKTDNKTKNKEPTQNLKQVNQTYPSNLEAFDDTSQSSDLSEHTEFITVSETSLKHPELSTVSETSLKHPELSTVSETSLKHPELSTVSETSLKHPELRTFSETSLKHSELSTVSETSLKHPELSTVSETSLKNPELSTVSDKKDVEKNPPVFYYCKICKKRFKTYEYLSKHQKANHITKKEKKELVKTLEEQQKTDNKTKNKERTPCPICNKYVICMSSHKIVHREKRYVCDICGHLSRTKPNLATHLRVHMDEPETVCKVCNKEFKFMSSYNSHKYIHTGERRFSCHICGKKYTQRSQVRWHIRFVHEGYRPYSCNICGKKFTRNSELLDHLKAHGNTISFSCGKCQKEFSTKLGLRRHVVRFCKE